MVASGSERRAPSANESDEVIDVVSHAPANLSSSRVDYARNSVNSSSYTVDTDGDEMTDNQEDEDEELEEAEEHEYRRGRHAVPMRSPGEELMDIDLLSETRDSMRNLPRLPKLRHTRVFFQSDDVVSSAGSRERSSGGGRVLFRRRKRQEGDVFWTAIFVSNVLSLAVLSGLVIYLTQTDFFASHQNDLFGTTVDNRFTVVSQQDSHAKIYLKSGYSNSRYSEAMIAFGSGILQLGRRALASTDAQKFYGLSLAHNGSAVFTNKVSAPAVATDYLHAGKAVVFEDGTVMTTAANMSGGIKEIGDLNFASTSGSVITSAGGNPVLVVGPKGTVVLPNADAEDANAMGIAFNAAAGRMSIANSFSIEHTANASRITSDYALHVNTTRVAFGSRNAAKVTLTVSRLVEGPTESNDSNSGYDGDDDEKDDNGARQLSESMKPMHMEIVGQSSSSQDQGGDVLISGGDGLSNGGNVIITGGVGLDLDALRIGSVAINAQLDPSGASLTDIGTQSGSHSVYIQGNVVINGNKTSKDNSTQVAIAGPAFDVHAKKITISNVAANSSTLKLDSNDLRVGTLASSVKIGSLTHSALTIQGTTAKLDAAESIAIGDKAQHVSIGNASRSDQSIEMASHFIRFTSSTKASTRSLLSTGLSGNQTTSDLEITNGSVRAHARTIELGANGNTKSVVVSSADIELGARAQNTSINANGAKFSVSSKKVHLGAEDSTTVLDGETVAIDAAISIAIGEETDSIALGSKTVEELKIRAQAVAVRGSTTVNGKRLLVDSAEISLGGNTTEEINVGGQSIKKTVVDGQTVGIGSTGSTVSIGSASPVVSIGSSSGVINLKGKITLNGEAFESRRRLTAMESWFGYLNAGRFEVDALPATTEFVVPIQERFALVENTIQFDKEHAAFQTIASGSDSQNGHMKLSLALDNVRLNVPTGGVQSSSKLRCRVYQQKADAASAPPVVLEASGAVEQCSMSECETDIFFGVTGERIVRYDSGDSFEVKCLLASGATGTLLIDSAQFWFTNL